MTPPTEPNFYFFTGVRITRNNQRVAVNEPVQVVTIWVGHKRELGVAMIGTQRRTPLTTFDGEWRKLEGQP